MSRVCRKTLGDSVIMIEFRRSPLMSEPSASGRHQTHRPACLQVGGCDRGDADSNLKGSTRVTAPGQQSVHHPTRNSDALLCRFGYHITLRGRIVLIGETIV
jgi:hypothetical protein